MITTLQLFIDSKSFLSICKILFANEFFSNICAKKKKAKQVVGN